jgi:hypothetical protein
MQIETNTEPVKVEIKNDKFEYTFPRSMTVGEFDKIREKTIVLETFYNAYEEWEHENLNNRLTALKKILIRIERKKENDSLFIGEKIRIVEQIQLLKIEISVVKYLLK